MHLYPGYMLVRTVLIFLFILPLFSGCFLKKSFGVKPTSVPMTARMQQEADAAGQLEQAMQNFHRGSFLDPENALMHLRRATELDPSLAEAYQYTAMAHAQLGQWHEALAPADKVIELRPRKTQAIYLRGIIHMKLGNHEAAISDMTLCITLDDTFIDAYVQRGYAHAQLGHYDRAEADYSQALAMAPNRFDASFNKGLAHFARQQYNLAANEFTNAIVINPDEPKAFSSRGESFLRLGMFDRAREDLEQSVRMDSSNTVFLELLALAYAGEQKYSAAVDTLKRAVTLAEAQGKNDQAARMKQRMDQIITEALSREAP